jgi:hypothetical protein
VAVAVADPDDPEQAAEEEAMLTFRVEDWLTTTEPVCVQVEELFGVIVT